MLMRNCRHAGVSVIRSSDLQQTGMGEALYQREQAQPEQATSPSGSDAWTEEAEHGGLGRMGSEPDARRTPPPRLEPDQAISVRSRGPNRA
jgi:hypothetical protein